MWSPSSSGKTLKLELPPEQCVLCDAHAHSSLEERWSLWCSAVSFGYISLITFWLFVCITSFYLSLTVILTSHFSNITYFRQQQQQNKPMKYYEILPTHTETPRNTTRKIANLYIEFNYHFLTLQNKNPITFEQECNMYGKSVAKQIDVVIQYFQFSCRPYIWVLMYTLYLHLHYL